MNTNKPSKNTFDDVQYQIGDVKDKDSLLQRINEYKPDIVINICRFKARSNM